MPYASSEFEVAEDAQGGLRVTSGNVVGALLNALEQNEVQLACRLYEESGNAASEKLLERLKQSTTETRDAGARMYAAARDFARAARLHEHAKAWPDAASLHAEGGDFAAAARCYQRAGDLFHAAQCADASGDVNGAIALYEKLGDREAAADCLSRNDRPVEAAALYRELGNLRGEIEVLRQVPETAPARIPAVKRLAEILASRSRLAEAIELVTGTLNRNDTARADPELHGVLADLFEQQGDPEHALRLRTRMGRLSGRAQAPRAPEPVEPVAEPAAGPVEAAEPAQRLDAAAQIAEAPDEGYGALKSIPLFAKLNLEDLQALHRLASEVTFPPGHRVIEEGRDPPGLIVLLEGTVDVVAIDGVKVRYLNSLSKGAYLGEISLLSGGLTSARVTASSEVRALTITPPRFDGFLQTHPRAALCIYRLFAQDLGERVRSLSAV